MSTTNLNKFKQISLTFLVGLMILQTGCKKEEEYTLNGKDTLNGTSWKFTIINNGKVSYESIFIFQESTFSEIETYYNQNTETYTLSGSYEYTPPKAVLFYLVGGSSKFDAKISGNQLITWNSEVGGLAVYTKQ